MQHRREFLQSCSENFLAIMRARNHVAYCDSNVPGDLAKMYYDELLPGIRAELAGCDDGKPHLVDRHKVAAATAYLILAAQPMRNATQLHRSGTYEGELCTVMNSQFAIYVSVAILDLWRTLAGEPKIQVSEKAKRFIREHVKLMTRCRQYPIFMAAQALYLFEELCLAEAKYASSSPGA